MRTLTSIILVIALVVSNSEAQLFYQFVEKEEQEVLAVLELSELPARLDQFVGLTFTEAGQEIFGFGPSYTGTFDEMVFPGSFIADRLSPGGLAGSDIFVSEFVQMQDNDPPSSVNVTGAIDIFDIQASAFENDDYIRIVDEMDVQLYRFGDWQAIPEPTSFVLALFSLAAIAMRRKRR